MNLDKPGLFLSEGHKISNNFESLLIRNGLHLPYSFYTFIVRERNSSNELTEENFIPEAYLYTIKGKNCLHNYIRNYNDLYICLNGLKAVNLDYLSMILSMDYDKKTPLDYAFEVNNKRIIHLLIKNLADLENFKGTTTKSLKYHFPTLLNFESFDDFLNGCFFQTK